MTNSNMSSGFRLQLAMERYQTDKVGHGYVPYYASSLPLNCRSLLEIGCLHGSSLRVWDDFYGPNCDIHTIDLFLDPANMSVRACREAGFVPHQGSQDDLHFLQHIRNQFEVIIDDGSHNAHHQIISFKHLFVNNLRPGGLYVIEDVACCKDSFYWGEEVKEYAHTILATLQQYIQGGALVNPYLNDGEVICFSNLIKKVTIYEEKIIFIWKN
jgi:hypothetical protein